LRTVFGEENYTSTLLRLFLEDILEDKRIMSHETARISSLNEEEMKFEDEKRLDDDSSLLGSCAHFLERLTDIELGELSKLLIIKQYKEGDIIYDHNESDGENNLIMVLSGAVR
jgi:hypothetical protein